MPLPCVLIDFENVQPKALGRLIPGTITIKVFLGQHQNKVVLDLVRALQPFGKDAEYIQIIGSGPDAVDFHIAFYIGEIAARAPDTRFLIVSKDKGFDPLVKHLTDRGFDISRLPDMPAQVAQPKPVAKTIAKGAGRPASTTKARAEEAVIRLKKSTRPTTLAKLTSTLANWFGESWGEKSLNAVLQSLQDSKLIAVTGTKVTYKLGAD